MHRQTDSARRRTCSTRQLYTRTSRHAVVLSHYTIIPDRGTNDKKTKKTTVLLSSGLDLGLAKIVSVTSLLGYRSLRRLTDQDYFRVCLTISTDKCDIGCCSFGLPPGNLFVMTVVMPVPSAYVQATLWQYYGLVLVSRYLPSVH